VRATPCAGIDGRSEGAVCPLALPREYFCNEEAGAGIA